MSRIPAAIRNPVVGVAAAGTAIVGATAAFGPGVMALATGGAIAIGSTLLFARGRGWGMYLARTRIDYRREIGDPATNSIVGAVVGWIARNFPQAPVRLVKIGTTEPAFAPSLAGPGAMLRLLESPNVAYSGPLQWMATLVDWYCRGNAYWLKARNSADRVVALWWVPERLLEPRWPEDDPRVFISHYAYTIDGVSYTIKTRDVVHFRNGIDPANPRKGLSPLASLFREIFTDDEAANFTASLLRNLGVPGVTISPTNTVAGAAQTVDPEAIKTSWMEKFTGDRRGEPFVSNLPIDVKKIAFTPQEMDLKTLRRVPEERISAVLGVPAGVAQLGAGLDRNTFTNYGEGRVAAYTEGVIPAQTLFAADLEVQLLPDFASEAQRELIDVWFDWTKVSAMQAFAAAIWKQLESSATKGLITRADFKRGTGQTVLPGDDVYILPNNYVTVALEPAGSSPAGSTTRRASVSAVDVPLLEAGPLKCTGTFRGKPCGKLLAEQASPPYRIACDRCKTVAEAGDASAATAA